MSADEDPATPAVPEPGLGGCLWWLLMGIDGVLVAIMLFFFTISRLQLGYWLLIWAFLLLPIWGGMRLRRSGRPGRGALVLAIPALPGCLVLGFAIAFFAGGAHWQ
jgi:hypothetical protein